MNLTLRQRRALEDICDTFCPVAEGVPAAMKSAPSGPRTESRRSYR